MIQKCFYDVYVIQAYVMLCYPIGVFDEDSNERFMLCLCMHRLGLVNKCWNERKVFFKFFMYVVDHVWD